MTKRKNDIMPEGNKYRRRAWLTIIGFTLFRFWYISAEIIDITGDEAHYWDWSRHLDINYYSKGPLVAYIIKLFTIFGSAPLFVRLGALVISVLFAWMVYRFSLELFNSERTAFYTVLVFEFIPLFHAGGILMTIDPPFLFLWLCSLYFIYKGVCYKKGSDWLLFGLCAGVGFLAKYTMFMIFPFLWLYLLFNRDIKTSKKNLLWAHMISAVFLLPSVIWNAKHNWATFRHVSNQVAGNEGAAVFLQSFFGFLGSQLGVISPLFFLGILAVFYFCYKAIREKMRLGVELNFLFWFSAPVFMLFVLRSFLGKVQGNWPAPAYVAAIFAMVGAYFGKLPAVERGGSVGGHVYRLFFNKKLVKTGFVIAGLTIFFAFPSIIESITFAFSKESRVPTARITGWKELGKHIDGILKKNVGEYSFLFSDSYQVTSELAFYTKDSVPSLCANLGRRQNQYDYWPGFERYLGKNGIFVKEDRNKIKPKLAKAFSRIALFSVFEVKRMGRVIKRFYIYECHNLVGFENIIDREKDF